MRQIRSQYEVRNDQSISLARIARLNTYDIVVFLRDMKSVNRRLYFWPYQVTIYPFRTHPSQESFFGGFASGSIQKGGLGRIQLWLRILFHLQ